jgi:predicted nucleotidyltransferase
MKSAQSTLILRVPASLHRRLKQEARWAETSLNRYCAGLLSGRTSGSMTSHLDPLPAPAASLRAESLPGLSDNVLETLGEKIDGLVLFGSLARGQETAGSDVDLLIVLDESVAVERDVYSRWQFGKFDGREIAPLFVKIPADPGRVGGLWLEVALDGIVLFDRCLRVSRFLSQVRNLIAGGRVKRMVTHGHPYWVYSDEGSADSVSARNA